MQNGKIYQGTKTLFAKPMTRGEYNAYRGWEIPMDEDETDKGYLVEYTDGGKPNDPGHSGYISWSPQDVFENTYYEVNAPGATSAQPNEDWRLDQNRSTALSLAVGMVNGYRVDPTEVLLAAQAFFEWLTAPPPTKTESI